MSEVWPFLALIGLGTFHGLNPAMGWLFAVGLGLQEKRVAGVLKALPPIALGHLASILITVLVVGVLQVFVDARALRYICAAVLLAFACYKLLRRQHPRWVGMRVGFVDLTIWSFLMATAHGAGLMLLPIQLSQMQPAISSAHVSHMSHMQHMTQADAAAATTVSTFATLLLNSAIHTLAMFVVMTVIAVVIYKYVGLMILRRTWFNLDYIWAGVLTTSALLLLIT